MFESSSGPAAFQTPPPPCVSCRLLNYLTEEGSHWWFRFRISSTISTGAFLSILVFDNGLQWVRSASELPQGPLKKTWPMFVSHQLHHVFFRTFLWTSQFWISSSDCLKSFAREYLRRLFESVRLSDVKFLTRILNKLKLYITADLQSCVSWSWTRFVTSGSPNSFYSRCFTSLLKGKSDETFSRLRSLRGRTLRIWGCGSDSVFWGPATKAKVESLNLLRKRTPVEFGDLEFCLSDLQRKVVSCF